MIKIKNDDLDFDNIDFSKYQDKIDEMAKNFEALKSDKVFMWRFNRYKRKKENDKKRNLSKNSKIKS